jgi:NAD dependent epimerase/dehydratase family enzyme
LTNSKFMQALRQAAGIEIGLPSTRLMLEVATFFHRTETELILKSRRVTPGRLLQSGFNFQFPDWESAARDLVGRYRTGASNE